MFVCAANETHSWQQRWSLEEGSAVRGTGLVCASVTDAVTNSYYNSTYAGLPMAGICLPGYSASSTPPSRVCELIGIWSSVTGSCSRTRTLAAPFTLRAGVWF